MRVVFVGSIEFSWHCLDEILRKNLAEVVGVFNVDPKYSRNISDYRNLADLAKGHKVAHHLFKNINDEQTIEQIKKLKPDLILVFGLSQIIKEENLGIASLGVIGTHPALLPKNRGRAAIPWSIIKRLDESGLTIFYLGTEADQGDIIDQEKWEILEFDDAKSLYNKMISAGKRLLNKNLPLLSEGKAQRIKQSKKGNWWPKRTPDDGKINWRGDYMSIDRLIRATTWPYPGAFTFFGGKKITIWKSKPIEDTGQAKCGSIFKKDSKGFLVKAKNGSVLVEAYEPKNIMLGVGDQLI